MQQSPIVNNVNQNHLVGFDSPKLSTQDIMIVRIAKTIFSSITSVFYFALAVCLTPIRLISPQTYFNITGYCDPAKNAPKPPVTTTSSTSSKAVKSPNSQQPPVVNVALTGAKNTPDSKTKTVVIEPSKSTSIPAKIICFAVLPLTAIYFAKDWLSSLITSQESTQTPTVSDEQEATPVFTPKADETDEILPELIKEKSETDSPGLINWLTDIQEKSSTEEVPSELDTQESSTLSDFTGWLTDNTETSPVTTEAYLPPTDSWTTSVFGSDIIPVQEHTTSTLAPLTTLDTSLPQSVTTEHVAYGAACVLGLAAGAWVIRKVWNCFRGDDNTVKNKNGASCFFSRWPYKGSKISSEKVLEEHVKSVLSKDDTLSYEKSLSQHKQSLSKLFIQFLDDSRRTYSGNLKQSFEKVKNDIMTRIEKTLEEHKDKSLEERTTAVTNMLCKLTIPDLLHEDTIGLSEIFKSNSSDENSNFHPRYFSTIIAYNLLGFLNKSQLVYTTREGIKEPTSTQLIKEIEPLLEHLSTKPSSTKEELENSNAEKAFHLYQLLSQRTHKRSSDIFKQEETNLEATDSETLERFKGYVISTQERSSNLDTFVSNLLDSFPYKCRDFELEYIAPNGVFDEKDFEKQIREIIKNDDLSTKIDELANFFASNVKKKELKDVVDRWAWRRDWSTRLKDWVNQYQDKTIEQDTWKSTLESFACIFDQHLKESKYIFKSNIDYKDQQPSQKQQIFDKALELIQNHPENIVDLEKHIIHSLNACAHLEIVPTRSTMNNEKSKDEIKPEEGIYFDTSSISAPTTKKSLSSHVGTILEDFKSKPEEISLKLATLLQAYLSQGRIRENDRVFIGFNGSFHHQEVTDIIALYFDSIEASDNKQEKITQFLRSLTREWMQTPSTPDEKAVNELYNHLCYRSMILVDVPNNQISQKFVEARNSGIKKSLEKFATAFNWLLELKKPEVQIETESSGKYTIDEELISQKVNNLLDNECQSMTPHKQAEYILNGLLEELDSE